MSNTKPLSELIWDGSQKRPATPKGWLDRGEDGRPQTCAITAAMEDAGLLSPHGDGMKYSADCVIVEGPATDRRTGEKKEKIQLILPPLWFRRLMDVRATPPCGCPARGMVTLFNVIQHLHDVHQWSRGAVSMWVSVVERETTKYRDVLCPGWGGRAPAKVEYSASVHLV